MVASSFRDMVKKQVTDTTKDVLKEQGLEAIRSVAIKGITTATQRVDTYVTNNNV